MGRWRDRELTYKSGLTLAKKARSKKAGKRLNARARLKIVEEGLELLVDGARIACIHPDDTATVFFPRIRQGHFYGDWLGLEYFNHPSRKRKPAIVHRNAGFRGHNYWRELLQAATPAVDGVQFCLRTGACLNPSPWPVRKQTDKAGQWRTQITKFQRTLKIMAKMGAFNYLPKEVWPEVTSSDREKYPTLTPEEVYSLIVEENPQQMVRRLLESASFWNRRAASAGSLNMEAWPVSEFKSEYNRMRDPVRKLAGCYIEEIPHELEPAVASAA